MTALRKPIVATLLFVVVAASLALPGTIVALNTGQQATGGDPALAIGADTNPSGDDPVSTTVASPPGNSIRDQIQTDIVRLRVSITEDGNATWRIEYWTRLDDENVTEAFESLQSDIQARPGNYTRRFAERIRPTVADAQNATSREMNASGFDVRAEVRTIPQEYGVITYSFEWSSFAAVSADGDRIEAGDAVDGLFLDSKSRLTIEWPEAYDQVEVSPQPDDTGTDAVVWRGDSTEFVTGEPRVVLDRATDPTTDDGATDGQADGGTGDGGGDGDSAPDSSGGGLSLTTIAAAVLVVLAAIAGVAWWRSAGSATATGGGDGGADGVDDGGDETPGGTRTDAAGGSTDPAASPPPIDQELLSNEEQVLRLLEREGGRMKQQEVVQELDWTEAKTSQVVSGLRDDGEIETFRLGRENVLTYPDEDEL